MSTILHVVVLTELVTCVDIASKDMDLQPTPTMASPVLLASRVALLHLTRAGLPHNNICSLSHVSSENYIQVYDRFRSLLPDHC